jgi:hypothetical protein
MIKLGIDLLIKENQTIQQLRVKCGTGLNTIIVQYNTVPCMEI